MAPLKASSGSSTTGTTPAAQCAVACVGANSGPTAADITGGRGACCLLVRNMTTCCSVHLASPRILRRRAAAAKLGRAYGGNQSTLPVVACHRSDSGAGHGQRSIDRKFFISHNGGDDEDGPGACHVPSSAGFLEFPPTCCSQA